ncbi:MAG: glycoside hydrolase [Ruminococcus sp.]|nr:glycoside hydrolase [Ruminococcus sp.]
MKILKYISATVAVAMSILTVTSCNADKKEEDSNSGVVPPLPEETVTETITESVTEEVTEPPVVTSEEYPISYPEIEHSYAGDIYEAERERLSGNLRPTNEHEGFSGGGYVTGFGTDGKTSLKFRLDAPATQHYDISVGIASESNVNCRVLLDGQELYNFTTSSDGIFQKITCHGVFLEKGSVFIEVIPEGEVMLDYLNVTNSTAINNISYQTDDFSVNQRISIEANNLIKFLSDNYGKYTLTGQYVSGADNSEIELIHDITGQYPAIRFSTVSNTEDTSNVNACIQWHQNGGINGITWEWNSPSTVSSLYTSESNFSIWNAMTDYDISMSTKQELSDLHLNGVISDDCYNMVLAMDDFAEKQLIPLKESGVPVLWRPLYEASLGYDAPEGAVYWWGAGGAVPYQWLWNLMYNRYMNYFELDNLIWVWNGMSDVYSVDPSTYDIASYDLYTDTDNFGSRSEQLMAIQKYINNKIIAVSECDNIPDIDAMFRDNSVWSFFGLWNGEYITDSTGAFSEQYNTKDELTKAYNSVGSLTLDEYKIIAGGGELPTGTRNFSEELVQEEPTTEPIQEYGYIEDEETTTTEYTEDYNYDYNYDDYNYDYGYDYDYNYDYDYDYGYSEW